MPVVPPVSKTYVGLSLYACGSQRRTGPPRSQSSSKGGNFFRSSKPLTSLSGLNVNSLAFCSQNGQPVEEWKCHCTVSTVCASSFCLASSTLDFSSASFMGGAEERRRRRESPPGCF